MSQRAPQGLRGGRFFGALAATLWLAFPALSADLDLETATGLGVGIETSGPQCSATRDLPQWPSVWLGHFSGGRFVPVTVDRSQVDWRDSYFCFASKRDCDGWLRAMRVNFRDVEGYKTCLIIRGGPLRTAPGWTPQPASGEPGYPPERKEFTPGE